MNKLNKVIIELLVGFLDSRCTLYTDNMYASVSLFKKLIDKQCHFVENMLTNWKKYSDPEDEADYFLHLTAEIIGYIPCFNLTTIINFCCSIFCFSISCSEWSVKFIDWNMTQFPFPIWLNCFVLVTISNFDINSIKQMMQVAVYLFIHNFITLVYGYQMKRFH